jgi:hypothetical protein
MSSRIATGAFAGSAIEVRAMMNVCSNACWPDNTECGTTSVNVSQVDPGGKLNRYFAQFS